MSNHGYSREFKDEAVRQFIEGGHSVTDVSARRGVVCIARTPVG